MPRKHEVADEMAKPPMSGLESKVRLWIERNRKENSRLEFKKRVDISTPGAKAEFIRDVMALANSEGENPREAGHFVIGFGGGQLHDITNEHYDGAIFGQLLDSYIFPPVSCEYEEFSYKMRGRIGVLTVKSDPLVIHLVNKNLHDQKGKALLTLGQSWGRKAARKVELSGEVIHARLNDIIESRIDEATRPLKKRIKKLENQSGPALEVRKIRFEMEATSEWAALESHLQKLIPYAQEFDHVVKHEVLDAVMVVTGRTRQDMPPDIAQSVDSVLMEVMPIKAGAYHHPSREQFSKEDQELLKRIEHATFEMTWDACRYVRHIKLAEIAARLYWVLIRIATLNKLQSLKKECLHNARYCRHICTEERIGQVFMEGHKQLGETIKDALDAFEYDCAGYTVTTPSPRDVSAKEFARCLAILKTGRAVDVESARDELPRSTALSIVWKNEQIVGVGAIKRERRDYAASVAVRSGVDFPSETLELGYVAVSPDHRGHHLSHCVAKALLKQYQGRLFATTYDVIMKNTLETNGFENRGKEWEGREHMLSFWEKE